MAVLYICTCEGATFREPPLRRVCTSRNWCPHTRHCRLLDAPPITPCYEVADGRYGPWIALDIDVSVFDNSHTQKQGVSWTYKKVDGFAPIFAYLGQEGYLINCQLRQGSQHSQEGAPDFIRDTLRLARRISGEKLLVRMDSAHDDIATVRQLRRTPKTDFIVKRNLRRESKQTWLENAQALGTCTCPRPGKEVFTGSLIEERQGVFERVVYEVVRRTISAEGQALLIPDIEVQTWWSNLAAAPEDVIRLYREHSTCEQFHAELKTDMDLERLPSGKFATNALVLLLAMMAYNALRLCGQTSLREARRLPAEKHVTFRKKADRRRLRTVIRSHVPSRSLGPPWAPFRPQLRVFQPLVRCLETDHLRVCA